MNSFLKETCEFLLPVFESQTTFTIKRSSLFIGSHVCRTKSRGDPNSIAVIRSIAWSASIMISDQGILRRGACLWWPKCVQESLGAVILAVYRQSAISCVRRVTCPCQCVQFGPSSPSQPHRKPPGDTVPLNAFLSFGFKHSGHEWSEVDPCKHFTSRMNFISPVSTNLTVCNMFWVHKPIFWLNFFNTKNRSHSEPPPKTQVIHHHQSASRWNAASNVNP